MEEKEEKEEEVTEEKTSQEKNRVVKKTVKNLNRKLAVKVTISDRIVIRANRNTSMSEIYDMVARFGNVKDPSFRLMRGDRTIRRSDSIDTFLKGRKRHLRLDLSERVSKEEEEKEEKEEVDDAVLPGVNLGQPTARIRIALCFRESSPKEIVMNLSQRVEILEKYVSDVSVLQKHGLSFRLKFGDKMLRPDKSLEEQGIQDESLICEIVKPVQRCDVCLEEKKSGVRTYVVNWKCLGLCEEHRCFWLERLLQDGDYGEADMKMLTKALVMGNLKSGVLM